MSDARDRAAAKERLRESFLVEASAGTGKTTLIVDRICALVAAGIPIGQVAAITFTEKAAGELKLRLRRALEAEAPDALAEVESAPVSTIHAFCASLLREWPVEAGVDPGFAVLEERERVEMVETLFGRWLAHQLEAGAPAFERALRLGFSVEWWVRQVRSLADFLLDHRALVPAALPAPEEAPAGERLREGLEPLLDPLRRVRAACGNDDDRAARRIDEVLEAYGRFVHAKGQEVDAALFARLDVSTGKTGNLGRQGDWAGGALAEARTLLADAAAALESAAGIVEHNVLCALVAWLEGFLRVYAREKRERGVLDFDDLLVVARDLVAAHAHVRESMRRRYHTLIIDEFQDTDPLQCELAFLLCGEPDESGDWRTARPEPGRIFLVGDPKQSIYAFRRADVQLYDEVKQQVMAHAGEALGLERNFRCTPGITAWVNRLFPVVFEADARDAWQADYRPIEATRDDEAGSGVHILRPDPDTAAALEVDSSAANRRACEARTVAALIQQRVPEWTVRDRSGSTRPARSQDVAVLFRAMGDAVDAYEEAFKAAGLTYAIAGGKRLYLRQEVRALRAVCAAVANPADGPAISAALKSPFFGVSDAALFAWRRRYRRLSYLRGAAADDDSLMAEAMRTLRRWHERAAAEPADRSLMRILEETGAAAAFAVKPDGDQRLANLHRLVEEARRQRVSFRRYVHWLSYQVERAREEGESPVLDPMDPAVRFLTIHKAKGLEFPIVVLADPAYVSTDKEPCFVDRDAGRLEIRLGGVAGAGLRTNTWDEAKVRERARARAEESRVLYVAATRAREALIVPLFADKKGDLIERLKRLPDAGRALWNTPFGESVPAEAGGPAHVVDTTRLTLPDATAPVFRLDSEALAAAIEAERAGGTADPDAESQARAVAAAGGGRRVVSATELLAESRQGEPRPMGPASGATRGTDGRRLGVIVHRALETADLSDAEDVARLATALARAEELDEEQALEAGTIARRGARLPTVRTAVSRRHWRELPFAVSLGDTLVEGTIDLAFEDRGELVIVDYKTDHVSREMAEQRAAAYELQGALYAVALEAALGLPVREVVFAFARAGVEVPLAITDTSRRAATTAAATWLRPPTPPGQLSLF